MRDWLKEFPWSLCSRYNSLFLPVPWLVSITPLRFPSDNGLRPTEQRLYFQPLRRDQETYINQKMALCLSGGSLLITDISFLPVNNVYHNYNGFVNLRYSKALRFQVSLRLSFPNPLFLTFFLDILPSNVCILRFLNLLTIDF